VKRRVGTNSAAVLVFCSPAVTWSASQRGAHGGFLGCSQALEHGEPAAGKVLV
jgi:hypothetical protein